MHALKLFNWTIEIVNLSIMWNYIIYDIICKYLHCLKAKIYQWDNYRILDMLLTG